MTSSDTTTATTTPLGGSRLRRVVDLAARHPVCAVGLVAALVAVYQLWWIRTGRPLGTFDTDEAGYMATALRFHRNLVEGGTSAVLERIRDTSTGPIVPLTSVPFLLLGRRSVLAVMAVQPLLQAVTAMAVTGIARKMGTGRQAVAAGLVTVALPALVLAGRSYQLAGGAAAALCVAVWALLASDHGRRIWPMIGFGVAIGVMLLGRTMSVVYLPGLALGMLCWIPLTRHTATRLIAAAIAAFVVAAPWWISAWMPISDYLLRYGYGDRAASYGSTAFITRVLQRVATMFVDLLPVLALTAIAAIVLIARTATLRVREDPSRLRTFLSGRSAMLTVAVVVATGWILLLSSSNAGKWFELPLLVLAVPLLVRAGSCLPARQQTALASFALGASALHLVLLGTWAPIRNISEDPYGRYERIASADPRVSGDATARRAAGSEWWSAHEDLVRAIDVAAAGNPTEQVVSGSSALINGNSLLLAEELDGVELGPLYEADSTSRDRSKWLSPTSDGRDRVVVVMRSRAEPFPPDAARDSFLSEALERGWSVEHRVALPDGGDALVLVHPGGSTPAD